MLFSALRMDLPHEFSLVQEGEEKQDETNNRKEAA